MVDNGLWKSSDSKVQGAKWITVRKLAEGESQPDTEMLVMSGGRKAYEALSKQFPSGRAYINKQTDEVCTSEMYEQSLLQFNSAEIPEDIHAQS